MEVNVIKEAVLKSRVELSTKKVEVFKPNLEKSKIKGTIIKPMWR